MGIDLVQKFEVEIDSITLLGKYLILALSSVLDSTEEIAIKVIDHNDNNKSLCYPSALYGEKNILPILLIEGWYKHEGNKENSYFNGYKPWMLFNDINSSFDYIISFLNDKEELTKKFLKDCGDGYNNWFNEHDGSIGTGYKLISNNTFPASMSLSLVHIYYGK
jgi:hypothetical protein